MLIVRCYRFGVSFLNHSIQINMQKFKNHHHKIFGYKSKLFRVYNVKLKGKSIYKYQFRNYDKYRTVKESENKSKLWNRYTLSALTIIIGVVFIPCFIILYFPYQYFEGGYNFIVDSAWVHNVRFFNWINIILLIALMLVLFLH